MSIVDTKKPKKGRPAADTAPVHVRLPNELIQRLDDWRREQPDMPGRPEAIRRILDANLHNAGLFDEPIVQLKARPEPSDQ